MTNKGVNNNNFSYWSDPGTIDWEGLHTAHTVPGEMNFIKL